MNRVPTAEREVTLTRVFDAPRELVWKVWTEPEHIAKWWGPHEFTNPVCEWEARPGGKIYVVMKGMGMEHAMTGEFREVSPIDRLVFMNTVPDPEGLAIIETLTTVDFADQGDKTLVTLNSKGTGYTDSAVFMLQGMEMGWSQSLEKLAELLTQI